jgi:hypothetical protein
VNDGNSESGGPKKTDTDKVLGSQMLSSARSTSKRLSRRQRLGVTCENPRGFNWNGAIGL